MNDDDSGVHKPLVDNFEKFQELTDQISENIPIVANYVEALKEYKGKMGTQQDTKSMRTRMNHEIGEANELIKQTLDLIQDLEDLKFKNKKDTDNKKKMLRRLNNSFEEYYEEFTKLIKEIHSNEKRFIDLQQSIYNASTLSEQDHKGSLYDSLVQKSSLIGENNEGNHNAVEQNHNNNQAIIGSIHENDDENEEVHIDDIVVEEAVVENKGQLIGNGESIVKNEEEQEKAVSIEERLQDERIEIVKNKEEIDREIEGKKNESIVGEQQEVAEENDDIKGEEEEPVKEDKQEEKLIDEEKEEVFQENIQKEEPIERQEEAAVIEENNAEENMIQEPPVQEEEAKESIEEPVQETETPVQEEVREIEENKETVRQEEEEEVKENIVHDTPVQEGIKENEEVVQETLPVVQAEEVKVEIAYETPIQEKVHEEIIEVTVPGAIILEPPQQQQQVHKESIRNEEMPIVGAEKNASIVVIRESFHEKKNGESAILKKSVREEIPRSSIRMQSSVVREDVGTLKQSIMEARNNLDFYASIIQERERQMATVKRISSETNLLEGHRERHEEGNVGIVINDVSNSHTMDRVIEGGVEKKEKKSNTGRNVLIVLAIILILGGVGAAVAFGKK